MNKRMLKIITTPGVGGGVSENSNGPILDYGVLFLSDRGSINDTSIKGRYQNGGGSRALYTDTNNGEHKDSLMNLVGYDSNGNELERFNGIRFVDNSTLYSFIKKNFSNNGINYNNIIKGFMYDEIDRSIAPINKVYGINGFYSMLVGTGKNKYSKNGIIDYSEVNFGQIDNWIEDVIKLCTDFTGYIFNALDEPRRIIRRPSNHRSMYGLLNADGQVKGGDSNKNRRTLSALPSFYTVVDEEHNVDHAKSYYCVLNYSTQGYEFFSKNDVKKVMYYLERPDYSVIICYSVRSGDRYAVYIKPVGIDTIYTDFVNGVTQRLEGITHAKNQYVGMHKIGNGVDAHLSSNMSRFYKNMRMRDDWKGKSKGGSWEKRSTRFIVRDKTTLKVSELSKAEVIWRGGRDKPLCAMVSY